MNQNQLRASSDSQVALHAETRVDGAHAFCGLSAEQLPKSQKAVEVDTSSEASEVLSQAHSQSTQLAEHLQGRQRQLDHRESELNARLALIENDLRVARLWLEERRLKTDLRQTQLIQQETQLRSCLTTLGVGDPEDSTNVSNEEIGRWVDEFVQRGLQLEKKEGFLAQQKIELEARKTDLEVSHRELVKQQDTCQRENHDLEIRKQQLLVRSQEIEAAITRFKRLNITEESLLKLETRLAVFDDRQQYLEAAETLLLKREQRMTEVQQRFEEERAEFYRQRDADRRRFSRLQQRAETELKQQREKLQERVELVERKEWKLARRQVKVAAVKRDSLVRLATEGLGEESAGGDRPVHGVAELREELAEHYRLAEAKLQERQAKQEVSDTEQCQRFSDHRADLEIWLAGRQDDLVKQEKKIANWEEGLRNREVKLQQIQCRWDEQHRHYQQEITRLLKALRQDQPVDD